jgi:hypothetical protein
LGVQPWARKHRLLPQSPVGISFACDPTAAAPAPTRDLLLSTLQRLQKDLAAAGIPTLLDTTRATDPAWTSRAEDLVTSSSRLLVVCTPELKRQAMEGWPGTMTLSELLGIADHLDNPDATTAELEELLSTMGLSSLQREVWFIVRQPTTNKADISLLLLLEGIWDSSVPSNFVPDDSLPV